MTLITPVDEAYLTTRRKAKVRPSQEHGRKPPKIERGTFPIPVETRGGGPGNTTHFYPLEKMKVGHSFWVSDADGKQCTAGAVSKFAKKSGWKFITRGQSKDGKKNIEVGRPHRGTRVWRVE